MDYSIVGKINFNKDKAKKIGQYFYDKETDALYFEGPWPFPVQLLVSEGLTRCIVTPGFLKLPFILRGWINLDILLREIDLMKMALCDKLLLHASCVDGILIVGFPNSGKTYQTFKMVSEGGTLISEEYTVIQDGKAFPYKKMTRSCFSKKTIEDCGIKISFEDKVKLFASTVRAAMMPFMFEAVIWKTMLVSGIGKKVKKIVYGSTGEEVTNYRDLIILTENEFPFMANDFLQAYAICTGLDLMGIQNYQRKIIKDFVNAVSSDPKL